MSQTHMLSVREALRLPAFKTAELSGGESGLDNLIRWVHIVDLPGATFEWARGGELLLTSGVGLSQDPAAGEQFVARLAAKRLAGMVLATGHAIDTVPEGMAAAADQHALPLICVPRQVRFIDLTEAIFSRIVDDQYALQVQAADIHKALMDLVLEGDDLQGVAEALATFLKRSITVESATFDVMADSRAGPIDEARRRSVAEGQTTSQLAERLLQLGIYDRLLEQRRPMRIEAMPDLGMTMERIVAPIIVSHQIIGYVWIIAGDRELTELDELAIDHAATAAAVLMLKDREVQDAERRLRGDLLDQLLDLEGAPGPEVAEQIQKLGFHAARPFQVMVIEGATPAGESQLSLPRKVERWLSEVNGPALVVPRGDQVVVVSQTGQAPITLTLAGNLVSSIDHPAQPLRVGIGEQADALETIRISYVQASETLRIARQLDWPPGAYEFHSLGMLHWLRHLPERTLAENPYFQAVRDLANFDRETAGDLLATLETFVHHGGHRAAAAADLNIHRNTLAYRLGRIHEILDLDPTQPVVRAELAVAVKAYRLRGP